VIVFVSDIVEKKGEADYYVGVAWRALGSTSMATIEMGSK
jgi:hypothetical protein